ncbi:MAG: 16S rRNA (guanine(966)-N(2))-methyltransferase RsmD [Candidatus Dormibacteria bacterium]
MAETRITGGAWRGRVIPTPGGAQVRPTRSMVRAALFNILGQNMDGWRIVDLYAGAGSVGFEALSRGAAHVLFVERHAGTSRLIAASADRFGCTDRCGVVTSDVIAWLRRQETLVANLVFLDAPYRDEELTRALGRLGDLAPELVVCEHHAARRLPDHLGELLQIRRAVYGLTALTFFRREGETGEP